MPEVTIPCRMCDAHLHMVADHRIDEWVWEDEQGHRTGTDRDLAPLGDPYARLAWLATEIDRAQRAPKSAGRTWLYWARAREYSSLSVRVSTGTWHVHQPAHLPPPYPGIVPYHCGWPAQLRPSGWTCRQCSEPVELPGTPGPPSSLPL
jgi:hypothetical protein